MTIRLLYTLLLCGAGSFSVFAQTISPLGGYDFPQVPGKTQPVFAKMNCDGFDVTDVTRVLPGETIAIPVATDTSRLDGELSYSCNGCPIGQFGQGQFARDTFFYTASPSVQDGLETFTLRTCEQDDPDNCSPDVTLSILVQREAVTVDLGNQNVEPGGTIDAEIPLGNLPGNVFCRTVESCNDDYPGREQRVYFQFGINQDNEIRYEAARAAGTDQVCVTLCTALGLCDTYTTSFTITRPTLNLPFFDDFSYDGFRPDFDLWQDEDVLVNRNFPVQPPSIGVATFDGVDFNGFSYTDVSGTGPTKVRDYLTSAPIDLLGEPGTVLNFYAQPRGLGNRPEKQDSFLVQFLSPGGEWRTVLGIEGVANTVGNQTPIPFEAYRVDVGAEYLYRGFQFRFANKSNERGAVDMWHLDYVKLDNASSTLVTQDLALVETPEVLLEPYTSLPLRHYQAVGADLLRDSLTFSVFNHRNDITPVSTGNISVRQVNGNAVPGAAGGLIANNLFPGTNGIEPLSLDTRRADLAGWNGFQPLVDFLAGLDPDQSLTIFNRYALFVATEDTGFSPFIFDNSNVSTPTSFDEYLAYDDGTAEATLEIDAGNTIVQTYDTYVNDEMTGVQIRLPRGLGALGNQQLKLVVYTGDTMPTDLLYEEEFDIIYAEDSFRDSLQGYTTYLFDEVLDLPAGTVYVGWEQQSADRNIGVGFDRNNSPKNVQWFNVGGGFQPLVGTTTGAIMLRPLLSGFEGFPTDTDDPVISESRLEVFPNPTSSTLHLRPRPGATLSGATYRLFSFAGALLRSGAATPELNLAELPAGAYLLEVTDGAHRERHKIIRR